jgi:putative ABC transport system permease protein
MEKLLLDLRFGFRMLIRNPGFTLIAVFAIALGIGANTAIFSVVNAVLLRPLPYPEPDKLVVASLLNPLNEEPLSSYGNADFQALHKENQSFEHVASFSTPRNGFNLTGGDSPEQVSGSVVSADFFEVLRINPILGRTFLPHEDKAGSALVAVISHRFWQHRLNGDPNALNQPLTLNGESYYVIGVMPPDFRFTLSNNADIYVPAQSNPAQNRPPYYMRVIGRLKSGVSEQQADADVSAIAASVQQQYPGTPYALASTKQLKKNIVGESELALYVLLGAVFFVLLIASVNVANLLLARATGREKEMAVRAALGASGWRLARQTLTESVLLAGLGGVLGLLLAMWGVDLLMAFKPQGLPRLDEVDLDLPVLTFTVLISLLSGLIFGIAPAIQSTKANLNTALKEGGRSEIEGFGKKRLRSLLVISEVALALMLLVGAGLLIRSFLELQRVNPGFDARNVLTLQINLPGNPYRDQARSATFHQQLIERLSSLPGVESASLSMALPPNLLMMRNPFTVEGQVRESEPVADQLLVSPDYFDTFRIRLLEGRAFTDADNQGAPQTIIIDRTMARQYFPGESPIGKKIQTGDYDARAPFATIVGLVDDVKYTGLNEAPRITMYTPYLQNLWWRSPYLAVRTSQEPVALTSAIRNVIWELDRDLPISSIKTADQLMADSVAEPRAYTVLLGLFGAVALLLATVGIYGVMSYVVKQRRREIGIRMAMGARQADVLKLVVKQGMRLALSGVGIGMIAAFALTRLIETLLFGVSPSDVLTFVAVPVVLTAVALLACFIPARRASKIDPMIALRYE